MKHLLRTGELPFPSTPMWLQGLDSNDIYWMVVEKARHELFYTIKVLAKLVFWNLRRCGRRPSLDWNLLSNYLSNDKIRTIMTRDPHLDAVKWCEALWGYECSRAKVASDNAMIFIIILSVLFVSGKITSYIGAFVILPGVLCYMGSSFRFSTSIALERLSRVAAQTQHKEIGKGVLLASLGLVLMLFSDEWEGGMNLKGLEIVGLGIGACTGCLAGYLEGKAADGAVEENYMLLKESIQIFIDAWKE